MGSEHSYCCFDELMDGAKMAVLSEGFGERKCPKSRYFSLWSIVLVNSLLIL